MLSIGDVPLRLLKVAIATLFFVSSSIAITLLRLARRPITARFVVLAYHSIKRHERERFARQMDRLIKAAKPVRSDFAAGTTEHNTVYAAVTFDDGYQSVLENAIPVLAERCIPATLFVATEYLGGPPA